jgi:hypothetical protein
MLSSLEYNDMAVGKMPTPEIVPQAQVDQINDLFTKSTQQAFLYSGGGTYDETYATILSKFDRFGINPMPPNHEVVGYTFITRPKLNLSTTSLRQDRILSMLDTPDNGSLQFAMRCYLDTYFAGRSDIVALAKDCPFFNAESPFIVPLSNNLVSQSGWPDPVLDIETSDGGFFSEDFTMVKGSDRLNRTYDITLTFRDIQGGFILSMLWMWIHYIELAVRGDTTAYPEDIAARRINYTCSIYRFVLDPSRRYITKWAKATGCFPKSIPLGNTFNHGEKESFIQSSAQYSVPFTVNKVELMDPIIFRDFNTIMARYSPTIRGENGPTVAADMAPQHNFIGIPFIDLIGGYNQLKFICKAADLIDPYQAALSALQQQLV